MKLVSLAFFVGISAMLVSSSFSLLVNSQSSGLLDPLAIPKWVNQLSGPPPVYLPVNVTDKNGNVIRQEYVVNVTEFYQQMLPAADQNGNPTGFSATKVWGYGGPAMDAVTGQGVGFVKSTPGPSFVAIRDLPAQVTWVNSLFDAAGKPLSAMLPIDPTIHWANPGTMTMPTPPVNAPSFLPGYTDAQIPVPIVTHLHGGEVPSAYDGNPDAWFTANGIHGSAYNTAVQTDSNSAVYDYPNTQQPTTLWYHDHALGITRINILSGLAGFYLLRDPADAVAPKLPSGQYDIPVCIQDRSFLSDGSLYYPTHGNNPEVHPYWVYSFLGNAIVVNGKVWPNMNVAQGLCRFRMLDASNSRFYELSFSNGMSFNQIGSDGGYLKTEAPLKSLLLSPAERADILVDFSNVPVGSKIVLQNAVLTTNTDAEKQTVGQIMQFTVTDAKGFSSSPLPSELNPTLTGSWPTLQNVTKVRTLNLIEATGANGTLAMYLDGQKWSAATSETPELGSTEDWVIANPTSSAHPIHLHLVQFQIVSRQTFNDTAYMADWVALNGPPPLNRPTKNLLSLTPFLIGQPVPPAVNEQGWKDTVLMYAGQVTTIRIRFTQQDGSAFPFDATAGPGYVWHCHLLEHEDNEMMRPYALTKPQISSFGLPLTTIAIISAVVGAVVIAAVAVSRRKRHCS
jgi:spore coat protein A, manganese oxidase